ncbi:MAG: SDR family NAD(P)-dependent oxidoreductase, partial [Candidatus Methylomirabilia bacterium]
GGVMEHLKDRVAVVTGGASGIGRSLALAFGSEGVKVIVADVDEMGMAETVAAIKQRRGEALAVRADVSVLEDVQALADQAQAAFGRIHILCNNAGVGVWGGLETATYRDWQWVMGVNLWSVIHGLLAFLPRMIAQREGGHIVNTASMAGLIASQGLGIYNTTKYAVVGLSETLVKDLRPYNIGVSVLCPMGVRTRIRESERNRPEPLRNPGQQMKSEPVELMGRTLTPDEVAARVLAAIRENQLYVITHEEGLEPLRRRFQRMEQAIRSQGSPDQASRASATHSTTASPIAHPLT